MPHTPLPDTYSQPRTTSRPTAPEFDPAWIPGLADCPELLTAVRQAWPWLGEALRCARIPATPRDGDPPQASILALWLDPAATRRVDALFQSDPAEAVVLDQAAGALLMAAVRDELARQGHNAGRNAEQADHVDQLAELVRRGCAPLPRLSPGQREQLTAAGLALANEDMPATRHALITVVPLTGCAACRLSGSCPTAGRS